MSDRREVVRRLALALGRLDEATHLVISRDGSDRFVGEEGSNRFVQFARFGSTLRAESVGDQYLSGPDRLSDAQRDALVELGWEYPDESGNHWREWDAPIPLKHAAEVTLTTLERVHGVSHVDQLRFGASPAVLAPLTGSPGADPRVRHVGYWDYDRATPLTCPSCAWSGRGDGHDELHQDVVDVRCPSCDQLLVVAALPTLEETREAASAGNPRAIAGLTDIEAQAAARDAAHATLLRDPAELPELENDPLVISWDVEGVEPDLVQVLRHGDVVLWREAAFYESYRRFEEVFAILRARYDSRFAGLVPSRQSELWLYGDRLSSPAIVRSLNESVARSTGQEDDLLAHLAGVLGTGREAVTGALPSPAVEVRIDGADGVRWLACGEPVLVLVGLRDRSVIVAEPEIEWFGHDPVIRVRAEDTVQGPSGASTLGDLTTAISAVVERRLGGFQVCVDCGEPNPPEWVIDGPLCHVCAQSNHGVVF